MRIIKYIFILLILFSIGLAVYIATQNASFNVSGSQFIRTPRTTVYNYLNDYKNWETFASWNNPEKPLQFTFSKKSSGNNASMNWTGNKEGSLKTVFTLKNDSIVQKMVANGQKSDVFWKLKDTIGGTKVFWKTNGKLDFYTKVLAFFKGGVSNSAGYVFEETTSNLNKKLNYELNTFDIKINGVEDRSATFYIKQSFNTLDKNLIKNIKIILPKVQKYLDDNKLTSNGKPFIMYNKFNKDSDIIGVSVCIPVRDSINIMPGGSIASGELKPYAALKTTLIGDYAHSKKAWNKAYIYIAKNHLKRDYSQRIIEVYAKGANEVKQPSKYSTEILIPVYKKVALKPRAYKPKVNNTETVPQSNAIPTVPVNDIVPQNN